MQAQTNRKFKSYPKFRRFLERKHLVNNPGTAATFLLTLLVDCNGRDVARLAKTHQVDVDLLTQAGVISVTNDVATPGILIDRYIREERETTNGAATSFRSSPQSDRRYRSYNSLRMKLERLGFEQPGKLANFLLSVFVENGGYATRGVAESVGLVQPGRFADLRDKLHQAGVIVFDTSRAKIEKSWSKWEPGALLLRYLEEEAGNVQSAAAVLERHEELLDEHARKIAQLEGAVRDLIAEHNPPVTEEKVKAALSLAANN